MRGRKRDQWTRAHEAERLSQLIYDLESAFGRYMTECLRAAKRLPAEVEQEYEAAAADAEAVKTDMTNRVKVLFDLCCKEE